MPSLKLRIIAFLLLIHYFPLWPWPLIFDLEHLQCIACELMIYQIRTPSSNPRRSYCDFNIWPNDLERRVTCCDRLWDTFHQVWTKTTHPCLNYSACWYITSHCDLGLWPPDLELENFGCPVFKLYTKFERNWAIRGWVIDDFAHFRRAILGGGAVLPDGSQGCMYPTSPNLATT